MKRGGFVLLELLPALLFLMACLMISHRLICARLRVNEISQNASGVQLILPRVWEIWKTQSGPVLATRERSGKWEVTGLPDLSWLPTPGDAPPGTSGNCAFFFRKKRLESREAGTCDVVEFRDVNDPDDRWRWCLTVLVAD